ncbi:hypothetical protein GEMRC1_011474 [Eukaryota sp. GEM-RC1]
MLRLLALLAVTCVSFVLTFSCPPSEREALAALHHALGGPEWKQQWPIHDWDINQCHFFGIGCHNGKVMSINLRNNNLDGHLPNEIGCFPALRYLDLSRNSLKGPIVFDSWQNLKSLQSLDLSHTKITRQIPSSLCELGESLQYINLHHTQLSGIVPSCFDERFSKSLKAFHVHCSQLSSPVSPSFQELDSLETVTTYCNNCDECKCCPMFDLQGPKVDCGMSDCEQRCSV